MFGPSGCVDVEEEDCLMCLDVSNGFNDVPDSDIKDVTSSVKDVERPRTPVVVVFSGSCVAPGNWALSSDPF